VGAGEEHFEELKTLPSLGRRTLARREPLPGGRGMDKQNNQKSLSN